MDSRDKTATATSSAGSFQFSPFVSTVNEATVIETARPQKGRVVESRVESAIYAHIRAMRALGKHTINTEQIALALGLSVQAVNKAVSSLRDKGVKAIK